MGNQAPVITPVTSLTHVDLTTRIALDTLVTDPDGDLVTFGVQDGANGRVELSVDGRYVLFTPNFGFSGTGNFELLASDGLGLSQQQITVNVSNAALVNLDIVNRNPKLQVGDKYQLQVIGDFADQKGVVLLRDYVQYGVNTAAVSIDNLGLIRAISDGVGIISASRNGISAVTATRVGTFNLVNAADVLIAKAEDYGLDVYPGAVTLIPGMERQILVSTLDGSESSNVLTASIAGTQYFVSNPNIIEVSNEGLITVKQIGVADITVINHGAESKIALQVELPQENNSLLNFSGGAIKASDGAVVTIAPGALSKDTVVSIQQLTVGEVSQPLPPKYDFVGAFKLNIGDDELKTAAQVAISAPSNLAAGTEVFFLQKGEIPNERGELVPVWLMEESGRVGADGMIRTSSPPWNGVRQTGEFVVVVPTFTYSAVEVSIFIDRVTALYAGSIILGALSGAAGAYFGAYSIASRGVIGRVLEDTYGKINDKIQEVYDGSLYILKRLPFIIDKFLDKLNNPPISVLTVPTYGLPYTTLANVEINPGQIPIVRAEINAQAAGDYQPVVNSVELQTATVNGSVQPVLFLSGQNFGNSLSQLQVDLISATGEFINLQVIDSLSTSTKIAVKPTNLLPINSHGHLQVTRNYQTAYQPTITKFKSNLANLPDEPLYKSVSLVPQAWGNTIAVFNTTNPTDVINTSQVGSPDLLLAKISVGKGRTGLTDGPRYVAATSDGTIAYTPLESEGRVAVVDLLALQQVNTNHGAADPTIELPTGARPFSIAIDNLDRYAYIADRRPANGVGKIYVIDINPNSATYNKHIKTISIGTNLVELAQMAVSADGKSLFITAPKATDSQGHVLVVNIDASKKNAPTSQWQKQVADIVMKQGVTGVAVAPLDANHPERVQMAITNRQQDFNGFGVITVDNGNFAQARTTYTKLALMTILM